MPSVSGPGPKYLLGTTVGFEKHDPSLKRAPGAIIPTAPVFKYQTAGPGPGKYNITNTRIGPVTSPEWVLASKPKTKLPKTPSPAKYNIDDFPDVRHARPPAWDLGLKLSGARRKVGPAPKYLLPTTIGNPVPNLTTPPAYSVLGRNAYKLKKHPSPGPAKYPLTPMEVVKARSATPAILGPYKSSEKYTRTMPGPKYNPEFNEKIEPPSWTFGVKHSKYQVITMTDLDKKPFYE